MKKLILTVATAAALCLAPTSASAEWILTPFIGASFAAGTDNDDFDTVVDGSKMTYGGTITYLGAGILGFEADFGYSPEYFEGDDDDVDFVDSSNYTSMMANVVLSSPRGAFRPYGTAGVGLLKTFVDDTEDAFDIDKSGLGFNVGGGVMAFFTDNIGIRGDVRYFRQIAKGDDGQEDYDLGAFRFWRGTVGASFRF